MDIDLHKTQKYLHWMKTKIFLDKISSRAKKRSVRRGEVYKCNFGYGIGSEEYKERPCVIIQRDSANSISPNVIVAPITHTSSTLPVVVPISDKKDKNNNVILDGNVLLGNIICVSKARLGDKITNLTKVELKKIDEAIAISLDIKHYYETKDNIVNDKLEYIDKLKDKINKLEDDLATKEAELLSKTLVIEELSKSSS